MRAAFMTCAMAMLLPCEFASAVDGDIDFGFGTDGVALTDISDATAVSGMTVQTDGKVLVCGAHRPGSSLLQDFVVARFTAEGDVDPSFGEDGRAIIDFSSGPDWPASDQCFDLAVQPDGKIIAAGASHFNVGPAMLGTFAIARLNADGTPDATFGDGDGMATAIQPDGLISRATATAVAIQPDGRIVAAGYLLGDMQSSKYTGYSFVLARFNTDGALDPSFGTAGEVRIDFGSRNALVHDLCIDSQSRIVVGGNVVPFDGGNHDMAAVRLLPNGQLDPAFGVGGQAIVPLDLGGAEGSNDDSAMAAVIQSDGRIVLAGVADTSTSAESNLDMAIVRLSTEGALDPGFGSGGRVILAFDAMAGGMDRADAIEQQADGKLIVTGTVRDSASATAVLRLQTDGALDPSFGNGGATILMFGLARSDQSEPTAVAFQGDQIIVAGSVTTPSGADYFAARLWNSVGEYIFRDGFDQFRAGVMALPTERPRE